MPASNIPTGFMPNGTSIANQLADQEGRVDEMRKRMQRFSQTSKPGTGAWSVGADGTALGLKD